MTTTYEELNKKIEKLEFQVQGLLSLCGIYNRIIGSKVDSGIGRELMDLRRALMQEDK